MTKYTLLTESKLHRHSNGMFPITNGPMFVLFVIGVTIGVSFAMMYTQYTIIYNQPSHQLHIDRLNGLENDYTLHATANNDNNNSNDSSNTTNSSDTATAAAGADADADASITNSKPSQTIDNVHLMENQTLSAKLYNEVRVLCWILTTPKNHRTRADHVKRTWGKRCNKLIFISSGYDKSLDTVALNVTTDKPNMTWGKTKRAFQFVYEKYRNDADWFLKADDDTYVILENLRYFLYAYSTTDPIYFGYKMKRSDSLKQGYFSGGAGYVLSQNALHRFADALNHQLSFEKNSNCRIDSDAGVEDLELGKCMESLGVFAGDTRDLMKRGRFFVNAPEAHLIPGKIDMTNWYWQTMWYRSDDGLDCCSDNAISFHHIRADQMYSFDYLIYHLKPYGIVRYPEPLPKKINFSEIAAQLTEEMPDKMII